mmetsp:Transcript_30078/g.70113  ORF Transcript_30078/g.70113 Transcript_30078/m.70113 type:complete len:223 (-) Transcript_30078:1225-1893(-)
MPLAPSALVGERRADPSTSEAATVARAGTEDTTERRCRMRAKRLLTEFEVQLLKISNTTTMVRMREQTWMSTPMTDVLRKAMHMKILILGSDAAATRTAPAGRAPGLPVLAAGCMWTETPSQTSTTLTKQRAPRPQEAMMLARVAPSQTARMTLQSPQALQALVVSPYPSEGLSPQAAGPSQCHLHSSSTTAAAKALQLPLHRSEAGGGMLQWCGQSRRHSR